MNGGPFTLTFNNTAYVSFWWGNGDEKHLAYGVAHPSDPTLGANFCSFDQRALIGPMPNFMEGVFYSYGFTVRNDANEGNNPTQFDVYAATP
jgi:hypothetical protein